MEIYNLPSFENVDTSSFIDKYYSNGQIKRAYFLNDSLWTDSLVSYHQNGTIAARFIISNYTPLQGSWKVNHMPNYYYCTFYTSGNKRSEEFNNYYDKKQLSIIKTYLDSFYNSTYNTKFLYGDTLEGIFAINVLQHGKEPIVEYGRYKNGVLLDCWMIKGHLSENPTIMKIRKVTSKIELLKEEEIELEMKKYCFYYINHHFGLVEKYR